VFCFSNQATSTGSLFQQRRVEGAASPNNHGSCPPRCKSISRSDSHRLDFSGLGAPQASQPPNTSGVLPRPFSKSTSSHLTRQVLLLGGETVYVGMDIAQMYTHLSHFNNSQTAKPKQPYSASPPPPIRHRHRHRLTRLGAMKEVSINLFPLSRPPTLQQGNHRSRSA